MRAILQRVLSASVTVENQAVASIGGGLLVLVGKEASDTEEDLDWLAKKIVSLRLFKDETGEMNRSVLESGGEVLVVSQVTLFASTKKGTRPSWHRAASPGIALPLYEALISKLGALLGHPVAAGRFGAMMQVASVNDGPVTLIIDTKARE
jgi:D-aminoacyl-tRNA deacylase